MKIFPTRNPGNNETVYVNIQMDAATYEKLRTYMKVCEPDDYKGRDVFFPLGARLVKQGFGWYKLVPNNEVRACEKIEFALLRGIQAFAKEEEEAANAALVAEVQALLVQKKTGTRPAAYVDNQLVFTSEPKVVPKAQTLEVKPAVDLGKLHNLAFALAGKPLVVKGKGASQ